MNDVLMAKSTSNEPLNFLQNRLEPGRLGSNHFRFAQVLVMRRGGQVRVVRGVVVTKNNRSVGALIMIGIGLFDRLFLPDEEFAEMQERVIYKVDIGAQKPNFTPVFVANFDFVDKR